MSPLSPELSQPGINACLLGNGSLETSPFSRPGQPLPVPVRSNLIQGRLCKRREVKL